MGPREKHLHELSDIYGIRLSLVGETSDTMFWNSPVGWADFDTVRVENWSELDQRAYFAGLHEFGHFHFKENGNRRSTKEILESEAKAWAFALTAMKELPEYETINYMCHCFESYYKEYFNMATIGTYCNIFENGIRRLGGTVYWTRQTGEYSYYGRS